MGKRLEEIRKKNAEFEKESPYNFCDRWCERCTHEKQMCCKLYQDELEQKMTCIAHGREPDDPEITSEVMKKQYEALENIELPHAAEQYHNETHKFLEKTFYNKTVSKALSYDFETVAWYHTLLLVKLKRALEGFHESPSDDDFSLCDAVAQFEICKKAIKLSVEALHKIDKDLASFHQQILELIAILHNIYSRIEAMEESI